MLFNCKWCSKGSYASLDGLRKHHKKQHKDIEWDRKVYSVQKKPPAIKRNTDNKRLRCQIKTGAPGKTPRQCTFIHPSTNEQCKNFIIKKVARCWCHLPKGSDFAERQTYDGKTPDLLKYITYKKSGLKVKKAGNGVFTTNIGYFEVNDFITEMSGDLFTAEEFEEKKSKIVETSYAVEITKQLYLIGLKKPVVGKGLGSFINRGNRSTNNCKYMINKKLGKVRIVATKVIEPNNELFMPYGSGYKMIKRIGKTKGKTNQSKKKKSRKNKRRQTQHITSKAKRQRTC